MKKNQIRCPYCGATAVLRDASYIHGDRSRGGLVYVCSRYPACDSYVGVHQGTILPKGSLANRELRSKRIQAHKVFDLLWEKGIFTRDEAYRWMTDKFCLTRSQAHIGYFSSYMCDQLILESQKVLQNNHVFLQVAG